MERALGRAVAAPDLPGHGRAEGWDGGSLLAQSVRAAEAAMDGPVHLVGHSFGAVTALALAMERPGDVVTLTLIEPVLFAAAAGRPGHAAAMERFAPMNAALARGDREEAARVFSRVWGTGWDDLPERQRAYIRDRIHLIPAAEPDLMGDGLGLLAPGRLEALGMPVLLVQGGETEPVSGEILDALEARLGDVRRARVPGDHMAPVMHAGAVAEVLEGFWAGTAPRP